MSLREPVRKDPCRGYRRRVREHDCRANLRHVRGEVYRCSVCGSYHAPRWWGAPAEQVLDHE